MSKNDELWLEALDRAGVDNWSGYEYAQEIYDELLEERGDDDSGNGS